MSTPEFAKVEIGGTGEFLDGVVVDTPAGEALFRETQVAADPVEAEALARVKNQEPPPGDYGLVVRAVGVNEKLQQLVDKPGLTRAELDSAPVQAQTTPDIEYAPVALSVTNAGDTTIYTPAAGKRVRLHWVYAVNNPVSDTAPRITVKIGSQVYYVAWAISKRQRFTGEVNAPLIINLSQPGDVAVTVFVEEV